MALLRATLIDVGWGDSILLESQDDKGENHYGLIDSNDKSTDRSSYVFLKRFFERQNFTIPTSAPVFDWVLLTHAHADHGQGLKKILRDFGTSRFWYSDPRKPPPAFFADLLRYAQRASSSRVTQHDIVDTSKILPGFGNVSMQVLWPGPQLRPANENDNSVVLTLTLGNVCFVLTGDAEAEGVWKHIGSSVPQNTRFFKVPHHGSENGTFTLSGATPWFSSTPHTAQFAISSHIRPFQHPDQKVVNLLKYRGVLYRTDEHYHIAIETDGQNLKVRYSHI